MHVHIACASAHVCVVREALERIGVEALLSMNCYGLFVRLIEFGI